MMANFLKLSFSIFLIISPFIVSAAIVNLPLVPCGTSQNPKACTVACFYSMADRIIRFLLFAVATPLSATALMAAGILMVLGGSEKAISKGRDILKFTLIGLFVAFGAWLIIEMILRGLLKTEWYRAWNQFPNC